MGKAKVRGLFPFTQETSARAALREAAQARLLAQHSGRFPLGGLEDPLPSLDSLAAGGGVGDAADYRRVAALIRCSEAVRRTDLSVGEFPDLGRLVSALPDFSGIASRVSRLFELDGTLSDRASPRLSEIRTRLRRERRRVYEFAQSWLSRNAAEAAGDTVVLRGERYCVPVSPSAASRVSGIVHDRSASGQTVFLEPLEMTSLNNAVSLLSSDSRLEEERILREFGMELLSVREGLERSAGILAELDAVEARAAMADVVEGVEPEFEDGGWELSGARHPLLDARLSAKRRDVFGPEPASRDAVPLDVELGADKTWLLVSGPNAGGKTVVLKTVGLFSTLAQTGFFLPARRARLPFFRRVFLSIGDEQEILRGESTFSSAMKRLAEILREAGPGSLALLDELGSGTDPQEGGAIAVASLEEFLARGGRAVVTTHLSALKEFAAERPDAQIAAMEFDERTGHPTYRLQPGLFGRSRALSTARESGLPPATIARAESLLGDAWVRRERLEADAQDALSRLRARESELSQIVSRVKEKELRLDSEKEEFERRRDKELLEGREVFERARRELREASARAVDEVRRDKLTAARAKTRVEQIEREAAPAALARAQELVTAASLGIGRGDAVRLRGSSVSGTVESVAGGRAWVVAKGKRLHVATADLVREEKKSKAPKEPVALPDGDAVAEINVIGRTVDDAVEEVDRAIDRQISAGGETLRVIHGHGTGRLRAGLREFLRSHPAVAACRQGAPNEGGNGSTVVSLK